MKNVLRCNELRYAINNTVLSCRIGGNKGQSLRVKLNAIIRYYSKVIEKRENKTFDKNGWQNIDWKKAEMKVKDLQERIVKAKLEKDMKGVYNLQWKLLKSFEAQALAVRKVVTNKGGKTAGIDEIIWRSPREYWLAIKELNTAVVNPEKYKAQPVRRVLIPKPGTKEPRPLGIPVMIDRAVQAIYHFGIDPAVEAESDPNSYGFRKNRSTHDAITAIRSLLDKKTHPKWIVEADIKKCFDKIDHEFLIRNTPIVHRSVLEQWLKAGIMYEMNHIESEEGTPQGGIISPTLCNIAMNGIEKVIREANPLQKGISQGVHIIRYADDMIITAKSKEIARKNEQILREFLVKRGLKLNDEKTVITNIKEGFDFLGFNIKRLKWNPKLNQETDQETVLVIKPSEKGVDRLKEKIRKIITIHKPLAKIIAEINPVLRGWGEHKRISYHSQREFIKIDHWIYQRMLKWVKMHKGSVRKTVLKYIIRTSSRKWNWGISQTQKIMNLGEIPIIKITPLNHNKNPYIKENMEYFEKRREKLISAKFRALIYKIYKQKCPICGESLHNEEKVELHHIVPRKRGGKYSTENVLPLHEICHKQVTHGNDSLERFKIALPKKKRRKVTEKGRKIKKK